MPRRKAGGAGHGSCATQPTVWQPAILAAPCLLHAGIKDSPVTKFNGKPVFNLAQVGAAGCRRLLAVAQRCRYVAGMCCRLLGGVGCSAALTVAGSPECGCCEQTCFAVQARQAARAALKRCSLLHPLPTPPAHPAMQLARMVQQSQEPFLRFDLEAACKVRGRLGPRLWGRACIAVRGWKGCWTVC